MRSAAILTNQPTVDINELTRIIIGAALNVHRVLGIGLEAKTYKACLMIELDDLGISYEEHVRLPLIYKNRFVETGFSIDLLVEGCLSVDVLKVDYIEDVHVFKTLNHLRHADLNLGLILNFNSKYLKGDAIKRVVNGNVNGH